MGDTMGYAFSEGETLGFQARMRSLSDTPMAQDLMVDDFWFSDGHHLGLSYSQTKPKWDTLWLFNIAMENGPFIDDFPIKTTIYSGFSMAMLNNQMVNDFLSARKGQRDTG